MRTTASWTLATRRCGWSIEWWTWLDGADRGERRGRREVLGVEVAHGESQATWSAFLEGLVERGLSGVRLVVSDAQAEHPALAEWDSAGSRETERSPGEAA